MRPFPGVRRILIALASLAGCLSTHAGAPDWLVSAGRLPTPKDVGEAGALVLFQQTRMTVGSDGMVTTFQRRAIRILKASGNEHAAARVYYLDKTDRVRTSASWLMRDGKIIRSARGADWLDIAAVSNGALFDEYRVKRSDLSGSAMPGDIFGVETRIEGRPLFADFIATFDDKLPCLSEQFMLELPPHWEATIGGSQVETLVATVSADGRTRTWERRNRPYVRAEPWAAVEPERAIIVFGRYAALPGVGSPRLLGFGTWADTARWDRSMSDPSCDTDPALRAKAQQLAAAAGPDRMAQIAALCRFVQDTAYVAVNRNLDIGFGYQPRKATDTFARGFGDCKDKVNLLRALLREIGVSSLPISVNANPESPVAPAWPSPRQFNHAIIGIEVDETDRHACLIPFGPDKRLLVFDPTDRSTPLGGLPLALQGSSALVDDPRTDRLIALPVLPPATDQLIRRSVRMTLTAAGGVRGHATITSHGQAGAVFRRWLRDATPQDQTQRALAALTDSLTGATVTQVVTRDEPEHDRGILETDFQADTFTQRLPGSVQIAQIDVLSRGDIPSFSEKKRQTAIQPPPIHQQDEVVLELPPDCTVAERPADVTIASDYGNYSCVYETQSGKIQLRRSFVLHPRKVPAERYGALRKFLSDAASADRAAILLRTDTPASRPPGLVP